MDVFSLLISDQAQEGSFDYHPKCKELGLTHLIFADDLFLLSASTRKAMHMFKQNLNVFEWLSGNIFVAGISVEQWDEFYNIMGMVKGSFLVKYLGVPLISSNLGANDCN